ncbi:LysM peptidoglycan-binding domain-containing protein [Chloroflexota bacterium]
MSRRIWTYVLGIIGVSVLLLTGCVLPRSAEDPGDIDVSNVDVKSIEANNAEAFAPPVEAAPQTEGTVVRLQPIEQELNVGILGNVQILIDGVTNLYGLKISLQFDPNIIQIQDADPTKEGVQIQQGAFPFPDFVKDNSVDNETGNILYAITQTAPTPPANGNGLIATFTFEAVALGQTNLALSSVELSNPDGQVISATIQSGQVIVGQLTPTFTPIPGELTATPTVTSTGEPETPTPTVTPIVSTATPTMIPTPLPPLPTNTPLPPVTNIPPGATVGFCYRVQACETLSCIGQKFGVDPHYLSLVNDLHPPGYVFTHQALFIPEQHGSGPNVYIVQEGDTLALIADQCHLPVSFMAFVNCLDENATLQPGHVLQIPIPPFPPPSRYPHPPPGPPSVHPPPGPPGGCVPYGSTW